MKLIIEDDEGRRTVVPFVGEQLTIGRNDDNHVRLTEKNVSRKHGRIVRREGRYFIEDLQSFTGIRVNGEKIRGQRALNDGDLIQISEYDLVLQPSPEELKKQEADLLAEDDEPTSSGGGSRGAGADVEAARKNADTAIINTNDLPAGLGEGPPRQVAKGLRPRLVGLVGGLRGKEWELPRTPASIGRAPECDVALDSPLVSRIHCRLALDNGAWKVVDAESKNGVRVNGEPYAASALQHGDVIDLGPVKLAFALPGQGYQLPNESNPALARVAAHGAATSASAETARPRRRGLTLGAITALVVAVCAALWVARSGREHDDQSGPTPAARRTEALQGSEAMLAEHRYREAVQELERARTLGAQSVELRALPKAKDEARAEKGYADLEAVQQAGDFDRARKLLDALSTTGTYWGGKASERGPEVKAGYVKLHLAKATAAREKDPAACLTEANLALAADPEGAEARALSDSCGSHPDAVAAHAVAPRPDEPARAVHAVARREEAHDVPRADVASARNSAKEAKEPAHAAEVAAATPVPEAHAPLADADAEARHLLAQGNQQVVARDFSGAIETFEKAMALKPSGPTLGSLYRSLGIVYSRSGKAEEGARYYRLYLPYCSNPNEKAMLAKALADFDLVKTPK